MYTSPVKAIVPAVFRGGKWVDSGSLLFLGGDSWETQLSVDKGLCILPTWVRSSLRFLFHLPREAVKIHAHLPLIRAKVPRPLLTS